MLFDLAQSNIRNLKENYLKGEAKMIVTATVSEVIEKNPEAIRVFLQYKMQCVGCPFSVFHTLEIACAEHDIKIGGFLESLRNTVNKKSID